MLRELNLPERAVVAIFAKPEVGPIQLASSGVLIGRSTVLTTAHAVAGIKGDCRYWIFSQVAGAVEITPRCIHPSPEDMNPDRPVVLDLRHDFSGLGLQAELVQAKSGDTATILGIGGDNTGLVEQRKLPIKSCPGIAPNRFCLGGNSSTLGPFDSGSPVLIGNQLAGVYVGYAWREVERLEPYGDWLMGKVQEFEGSAPAEWQHLGSWTQDSDVDPGPPGRILRLTPEIDADLLIVTVNAVGIPLQSYIPDLKLEIFEETSLERDRNQRSLFQTIFVPGKISAGSRWRAEVTKPSSDRKVTEFQVTYSLFNSL